MSADETIRWVVILGLVGGALVVLLGGLLTPVAGNWRDGDRLVTLGQLGPLVWGRCERQGGYELYRGWALFNLVRLDRVGFGTAYLQASGFAPNTVRLVEGQSMARFVFHRRGGALEGTFQGRRFTFVDRTPPKIDTVSLTEPQPRRWERAA